MVGCEPRDLCHYNLSGQGLSGVANELRVLIVEDEMLLAMDIEALVEDCGHEVVAEVASLDEFEALAFDTCPQLALVDLHLAKGSSGLDVCRGISLRWPECVVVFLTANVSKLPPDYAGGHGVIAKPFSQSGMITALDYLSDAIQDPPPSRHTPASFTPSEQWASRW